MNLKKHCNVTDCVFFLRVNCSVNHKLYTTFVINKATFKTR